MPQLSNLREKFLRKHCKDYLNPRYLGFRWFCMRYSNTISSKQSITDCLCSNTGNTCLSLASYLHPICECTPVGAHEAFSDTLFLLSPHTLSFTLSAC